MKSIQYILKRSSCLSIMDGPDGEIVKRAIFAIINTKEFQLVLLKWEEISKNLTDTELEEVCRHIRDIYLATPINFSSVTCKSAFDKGKDFTSDLIKKLDDRGVIVDFNTMVGLYTLARTLEEANPNVI